MSGMTGLKNNAFLDCDTALQAGIQSFFVRQSVVNSTRITGFLHHLRDLHGDNQVLLFNGT